MEFFIRRYVKGSKSSGTSDVFVAQNPISTEEFHHISRISGEGKYILCVRGKGIRGFKKLDEYILEETPLSFEAETIAVQHNLQLDQLSSEELLGLMGNMINNAPQDAEGQGKFMSDLQSFHAELESRGGVTPSVPHQAEDQPLVSAGFPIGTSVVSFVLGAVTGGLAVWYVQKNTIDELKIQISNLEGTVQKAEEAIESVKKKAEAIEKNNNRAPQRILNADDIFLSQYNSMMGGYQP